MEMEPEHREDASGNPLLKLLEEQMKESVQEVFNYSGIYLSYSLSSSTDSLKIEPYIICASDNNGYVKVGMIQRITTITIGAAVLSIISKTPI